jgi:hypothetical protein
MRCWECLEYWLLVLLTRVDKESISARDGEGEGGGRWDTDHSVAALDWAIYALLSSSDIHWS